MGDSANNSKPVICFNRWAAMNRRVTDADVDSHIHAGLRSAPTTKTYARWNKKRLKELQDARDAAKAEYMALVEAGVIPVVAIDRIAELQAKAAGLPELAATQAARRLLEKAGVPVEQPNG